MLHKVLKFYDRQFYRESFEIIIDYDVAFSDQFVPVVQIAQADAGGRCGIGPEVDDVPDDGIVGGYGDVDGQGCFFVEFVMLDSIFNQRLHGDRGDEEIFGGKVGDLYDHADGFAEADLKQVEIVADELHFFFQQDQVFFFIAEDISIDFGQGVVIEAGVLRIACDKE